MTQNNLVTLTTIGSNSLGREGVPIDILSGTKWHGLGNELSILLSLKNGFYAFESALHVFPWEANHSAMGLADWNAPYLWRHEYGHMCEAMLFFAEDAFGNQFCLRERYICQFDAETGEIKELAKSFEEWACKILSDFEFLTGRGLLHNWQEAYGPISNGKRLVPKTPFVLGGDYSVTNLIAMDSVRAMRSRGNLASQLNGLQDGSKIQFRIID